MRHSPTAYKYAPMSAKGFHESRRSYGLAENSAKLHSVNAFGLKLVERSAFNADKRIPLSVKRNLRAQDGAWVLYLPNHERTTLFVGDNPSSLCALAAAHMNQTTGG